MAELVEGGVTLSRGACVGTFGVVTGAAPVFALGGALAALVRAWFHRGKTLQPTPAVEIEDVELGRAFAVVVSCDGLVVGADCDGTLVVGTVVARRVAGGEEPAWVVLRGSDPEGSTSMESVVSVP